MKKVLWSSKYNIGNKAIDAQHQNLINIINKLIEEREKNIDLEIIKSIFVELIKYANVHFHDEEEIMIRVKYPNYIEHKAKHHEFIDKLYSIEKEILMENKYVSFEILVFLAEWFINHIQIMDKDLLPYLFEED